MDIHKSTITPHFMTNCETEESDCIVIGIDDKDTFSPLGTHINEQTNGLLLKSLKDQEFLCKKGKNHLTHLVIEGRLCPVLIMSVVNELTDGEIEAMGGTIVSLLAEQGKSALVDLWINRENIRGDVLLASGASLKSWSFSYKTKDQKDQKLCDITFITTHEKEAQKAYNYYEAVNLGTFLTRHVISEPPNVLYPESMAQIALDELQPLGIEVEILGEAKMRDLGMNALLGVGQGSVRESKLILLKWMGGHETEAPIALVGKGITFDTGGISIKPSNGMEDMIYDMAGSGVVLGVMKSLAKRCAKVNVIGVLAMAENMPSGSAQRPSDIVISLSGQSVEVVNTDAEGRLVLADALWYTQDRFKPCCMVDLATLTGAVVVALGHEYAGLFSNDDTLATQLEEAAKVTQEHLWRLPLCDAYDKDINSDVADVKNVGSGRGAGSSTAAHFLKRFVNDTKWAHLDIAGVAWEKKGTSLSGKGATGFGVRLLNHWIHHNHERKS